MGIECQILLEAASEGIYKSGQRVNGTLKFNLDKRTSFHTINISLEGKGKCTWSDSSDDSTTWYTGKEQYISSVQAVMARPCSYMEAGVYSYPFHFFLPHILPTSFKNNICTISYKIVAAFKKTGLFGSKEFDAEIPVYGYLEPCSEQPLIFGLTKIPFSIMSNNAINLTIAIDKTFLMPGENIKLKCKIRNYTNVTVVGIKTTLITEITYISDSKAKQKKRKTIKESIVESPGVKENSVAEIKYIVPTLPSLYSIQHSKIFVREYKLNVTANLPFPHRNASVEIPVVIGERNPAFMNQRDCEQRQEKNSTGNNWHFVDMY